MEWLFFSCDQDSRARFSRSARSRSCLTIILISPLKSTSGVKPSSSRTFEPSPSRMSTSAGRLNLWSNFTKSFRSRSNALDVALCRVTGPRKAVKRSTNRLLAESPAPVLAEDTVTAFLLAHSSSILVKSRTATSEIATSSFRDAPLSN